MSRKDPIVNKRPVLLWVAKIICRSTPNSSMLMKIVIEFLSIQKPRAEEYYKKATRAIFEGNRFLALELISKGLDLFHDMTKLLLLRSSIHRERSDYDQALSDLERASKLRRLSHTFGRSWRAINLRSTALPTALGLLEPPRRLPALASHPPNSSSRYVHVHAGRSPC